MRTAQQQHLKFKVYEEGPSTGPHATNYADENFVHLLHPNHRDYAYLDQEMDYATQSLPSLATGQNMLSDFLMKSGRTKKVDGHKTFRWRLQLDGNFNVTSMRNMEEGNECPGLGQTTFQIALDCPSYRLGDVLATTKLKSCQVRVVDNEAIPVGTYWVYNVKLRTLDPEEFFPPALLTEGLRWCKIGTDGVGEATNLYTGIEGDKGITYMEFEVPMTKYRIGFKITDEAGETAKNIRVVTCDKNDVPMNKKKHPDRIYPYMVLKVNQQIKKDKEMMLLYANGGGYNLIDQSSQYYKQSGPGIYEFLEAGNVLEYDPEVDTLDFIIDFLQGIFFDRIDREKRDVKIYGGEMACLWGSEAIAQKLNGFMQTDTTGAISPIGRGGNIPFSNGPTIGLQGNQTYYAKYIMPTGGSIEFHHLPILDSYEINGDLKYKNRPATSWEMLILDFGLGEGSSSNIIYLDGGEMEDVITCGTYSPAGYIRGNSKGGFTATHTGQYYEVVKGERFGVVIKDVSRTLHIRPNFTNLG